VLCLTGLTKGQWFDPGVVLERVVDWAEVLGLGWIRGVLCLVLGLIITKGPFGFTSRNHKDQSCNYPKV
jgi:hypothetical protein